MPRSRPEIPDHLYVDARTLWDYHQMHHELRPCSVGIGLGSHDPSVPAFSAELFHRGLIPLVVFTGANSPTTRDRFPGGEAIHYQEEVVKLGVLRKAILLEYRATNTEENIRFLRRLLADRNVDVASVLLISKPYQQRRAFATCTRIWPDVEVVCASPPISMTDYVAAIGDAALVIHMLVGETQRVIEYPRLGYAAEQAVPASVLDAYARLVQAGYTRRLIDPADQPGS